MLRRVRLCDDGAILRDQLIGGRFVHAYIAVNEDDGTSAIWQLPIGTDPERRVFHLTDPARQYFRANLDVDSANFYVSIGGRQSDIWTIELKK